VLLAPTPVAETLALADGFFVKLTRYQGGAKGPVILAPGFTVRASSFAIDTVEQNLVEYLCENGFDVWLFDYRASPDSGSPIKAFTIDDIAQQDWPAAVDHVLKVSGASSVQVMAHCVGSMSLLMALLKGMKGVRSVISSALTLNPVTNWLAYLKVDLSLVQIMESMSGFADGFNIVPGQGGIDAMLDHQIDVVSWNVPVPDGESCKNPVCRRIFSIFGPSYTMPNSTRPHTTR
jgi:cholesterol oxidase